MPGETGPPGAPGAVSKLHAAAAAAVFELRWGNYDERQRHSAAEEARYHSKWRRTAPEGRAEALYVSGSPDRNPLLDLWKERIAKEGR